MLTAAVVVDILTKKSIEIRLKFLPNGWVNTVTNRFSLNAALNDATAF